MTQKEALKELNDILLDNCDINCNATHTGTQHIAIKNTIRERLEDLITKITT